MSDVTELYDLTQDLLDLGGASSGNWGHAGRPGKIGGSAPGGGFGALIRSKAQSRARWKNETLEQAEQWYKGAIATGHIDVRDVAENHRFYRESGPEKSMSSQGKKRQAEKAATISTELGADENGLPVGYNPANGDLSGNYWDATRLTKDTNIYSNSHKLALYAAHQGFDGLPATLTEKQLDVLLSTGNYVELHRGVRDCGRLTADALREQFRTGPCFYGEGIYGSGIYTSSALDKGRVGTASEYTRDGTVMRMALSKKAKIIDHKDIPTSLNREDEGNWAARRGYDAIHIACGHADGGDDYFVILNRTALFVQATDIDT